MLNKVERILRRTRVLVNENERAVTLYKGIVTGILTPGDHVLSGRSDRLEVELHDLADGWVRSAYEKALFDRLPQVAEKHLLEIRTGEADVAVIYRDKALFSVLKPDKRAVVWRDAGPWDVRRIDVGESLAIDGGLMRQLGETRKSAFMTFQPVIEGQVGLVLVDGVYTQTLGPGVHGFWNVGRMVQVKVVDLRLQSLDVQGQEVLTRDRVTIRVNVAAEYQVTDPVKAVARTKDFADTLYRALQYAVRRTLGAMTLDQILEQKVSVEPEAALRVRAEMAQIGVEVRDIALKDVILPGEMREILNQVVAVQKQAEANVIRRREETNATRSLLNTAKVMADNPVMLRLKELEALEAIAGKVDRLTVNSGTAGLLNDIARLREE